MARSAKDRGKMPPADLPSPIPGMEGPFRYKTGFVLYWDPREGQYYDRGRDLYLSIEEAESAIGNPIPNKGPLPRSKKWLSKAITRKGKLGGKGFLSRPVASQHRILAHCVDEYGYRSCLGSVMVLERIPRIQAAHGRKLRNLRVWMVKEFGGPGSFGRRTNPKVTLSRSEMRELRSEAAQARLAEAMGFDDVYEWREWKAESKREREAGREKNPAEPFVLLPELTGCDACMVKPNPEFREALSGAWEATKRGAKRVKIGAEEMLRKRREAAEAKRDPAAFTVLKSAPSKWYGTTSLQGELATDKRADGTWYKRIVKVLGRPHDEWGGEIPEEGIYMVDRYLNEYVLKWPDGVKATLYFSRDDDEVLSGRWNIGASAKDAEEAVSRIQSLFRKAKGARNPAKGAAIGAGAGALLLGPLGAIAGGYLGSGSGKKKAKKPKRNAAFRRMMRL